MKRYVLITGATGGLGKAFTTECAARGWDLCLTDLSDSKLAAVAAGLERMYGVDVLTLSCDLTDEQARVDLWQQIAQHGLRFHMLINVAGLDYEGLFSEREADELRTIVRLNIESTIETTRRALAFKDPVEGLRIITVSSLAAFYPMPVKAVYAASKRFLLDWSLALGQELRHEGVTTTALCPAGMPTTPACIQAIDAQGFMGRATTKNVGDVAAATIDHALAGRSIYVPGLINQTLRFAGGMLPPQLIAALINNRWRKSHARATGQTAPVETALVGQGAR